MGVKGKMLSFDKWGKYRLAYSVRKNEYGVYYLVRFDVEHDKRDDLLNEIRDIFVFKCNNIIMKHMFQRLNISDSLEYKRPESLEDNPEDLDDFLKKNDMTALMKKNPARKSPVTSQKANVEKTANSAEKVQEVKIEVASSGTSEIIESKKEEEKTAPIESSVEIEES